MEELLPVLKYSLLNIHQRLFIVKAISKNFAELTHVPSHRPDLSDFEEMGRFSAKI